MTTATLDPSLMDDEKIVTRIDDLPKPNEHKLRRLDTGTVLTCANKIKINWSNNTI